MIIHDNSKSEYFLDKSMYNNINNNDFMCWCHETAMIFTVTPLFLVPKGPRAQVKIGSMTCCFALSQLSPAHGFPFTKIRFMGLPKNGG
jgi:hypothetical protein